MSTLRRVLAGTAAAGVALSLSPLALSAASGAVASGAAAAASSLLSPSDGLYRATITRTQHGIPHIVADDYGSLGFGHGYATAETSLCNLLDTVITGRGERSRWLGAKGRYEDQVTLSATNLQTDVLFTDIRNRKVVEKLLADPVAGPGAETRAMVDGYVAGVNTYIRKNKVTDPACRGKGFVKPDLEPLDLWYGIHAANLLASTGVFVPQIVDAAPPTPDDPGIDPGLLGLPTPSFASLPSVLPSSEELRKGLGKDPDSPFGSNAWALGGDVTSTGRGMLLGNPHFPWRGRYRFEQNQLTIPGVYNVAGASLIGSPVVNIGFNGDVAWSHTVSTAYRFTPYEYKTLPGVPTTYLTEAGPTTLDHRIVSVVVKGKHGKRHVVTEDLYRTDEGYVIDAPDLLMGWTPVSFFAVRDANAEHLRTLDTFHGMAKARNVRELLAAQDAGAGMPWVNTMAADRAGNVVYADHSVVPNVSDAMVSQCATPIGLVLFQLAGLPGLDGTRAHSDCEWATDADAQRPGIFGPENLPDTFQTDWVINANDSYWLPNPAHPIEGFARIIGCEQCERTLRTRMVYRYVMDRLDGTDGLSKGQKVSPRTLRLFETSNRVFGAELARENGDLQAVCEAAEGGMACGVLARWDGRSDVDSVGTHLFQEFWRQIERAGVDPWEVPFDAADPVGTPSNLNETDSAVIQAMADAIATIKEKKVGFATPWGRLQVAGDEGAPPIPVPGGEGYAGNANAVASRLTVTNEDRLVPITYGSSHIQAIVFLDGGDLLARTILTYSQATDTTSPWSYDQTRLWSEEKWVHFAFTPGQIKDDAIATYWVRGTD